MKAQKNFQTDLRFDNPIRLNSESRYQQAFKNGDPDWIQTSDLLLRRQLLYSAELPDQIYFLSAFPAQSRMLLLSRTSNSCLKQRRQR